MVNGAYVYDIEDVRRLRAAVEVHERKAGNPNIATLNAKDQGRDR